MSEANFLEKVLAVIKRHELVKMGDTVIAAVSGGPDSVCLLHALFSLSGKLGINLRAIHINHMLRGNESDADEEYVRELCARLGIPLRAVSADIGGIARNRGISLEEAGREVRYAEFEKYADEAGASAIAVAHNRNDQAETVLMHILRGSGTAGLAGMGVRRGRIIRPLLETDRREIDEYCRGQGLEPRLDSTNLKDDFTRNRIRLKLIPYISENFETDVTGGLCRIAKLADFDESYLVQCAVDELSGCMSETSSPRRVVGLKLEKLGRFHPAIRGRVLRLALEKLAGSLKGIENIHVDMLSELAAKGATGPVIQLPHGIRARVSYGLLEIYIDGGEKPAVFNHRVEIPGRTQLKEIGAVVEAEIMDRLPEVDKYGKLRYNSQVQFFDYDLLKEGINIRNRKMGDVFKPYRSNGTKKLKEYLIDSKIPRDARDSIPVLALENEVVWLAGHKISDKFKVTENTKSVLKLEILKNTDTTGGQDA